jgi:pimeloyl-ACP methyl ester carboxylesterase
MFPRTTRPLPVERHARADISPYPLAAIVTASVCALAVSALVNRLMTKTAERNNPPVGKFVDVGGVRLHYVEWGEGEPLVLLHGNGSMIQDFSSSGLLEKAAQKFKVIAFDRPGFGYSRRPRLTVWTPEAQAKLFCEALAKIGIARAAVLGHSWGASVAVAMALHAPERVTRLILASGYFYPTVRSDFLAAGQAIPVIGDIISHTIAPILARLMWPALLKKVFGPARIPQKFAGFPKEMALRPSQLRASAAESALLVPSALALHKRYLSLTVPVAIVAGEEDKLVDTEKQSRRLHKELSQSTFRRVPGAGHMVHQTHTNAVMAVIDEAMSGGLSQRALSANGAETAPA